MMYHTIFYAKAHRHRGIAKEYNVYSVRVKNDGIETTQTLEILGTDPRDFGDRPQNRPILQGSGGDFAECGEEGVEKRDVLAAGGGLERTAYVDDVRAES